MFCAVAVPDHFNLGGLAGPGSNQGLGLGLDKAMLMLGSVVLIKGPQDHVNAGVSRF